MERDTQAATGTPAEEPGLAAAIRFQRDLYLYWRLIAQAGGAPLTTRQQVARPLLRRLRERLSVGAPEPMPPPCAPPGRGSSHAHGGVSPDLADLTEGEDLRLFFIRRLLERLSLLRAVASETDSAGGASAAPAAADTPPAAPPPSVRRASAARLVAAPSALMARYLAHPLAERLRLCARLWAAGGWWPERADAQAAPPRLLAPAPPRIAVARRRLLATLADHEPGAPVPLPEHSAHVHSIRRVGAQRAPSAHARRQPATTRPSGFRQDTPRPEDSLADDELTLTSLYGPLQWLGFVTTEAIPDEASAGDPGDHAGGLRVGVAALALRREFWSEVDAHDDALRAGETRLAERHGRLVAQSNLSLIAYPPLTALELLTLDTCASEVALDQTARYQLTRAALAAARAGGWGAAEVAGRLGALAGAPLPANVRVTLDDWERHVARASLTPDVTLLEVRERATLDALLADPAARGWVARRLTPTAALLIAGSLPLARGWLLRHGRFPAVTQLTPPDK
ncbi:MAG TPA: helicase-associated domain-containing protein [Ktedonobacterales bacterium]|nr:helicase-associated domain-containing protein [Ktedonobacterales bacterium]